MTAVAERAAAQPVGQDGSAAIRSFGLTKRFPGGQVAVDAVDLVVPRGAIYGFLGPNGSGKTTTIRMLLGLVSATSGSHELFGEPMPRAAGAVLPRVGALVEGPAFHPYLNGRDNLLRLDAGDLHGAGSRVSGTRQLGARTRRSRGSRGQALSQVLARHAAAARSCCRVVASPGSARAGRADQRPRPAGHPRGAPSVARGVQRGRDGLRVVAPAQRDRADLHATWA